MIPWLRAMTAMSQHKVNGTALLAGTMACSVSAATFIAQGLANVPVAAFLVRSLAPMQLVIVSALLAQSLCRVALICLRLSTLLPWVLGSMTICCVGGC